MNLLINKSSNFYTAINLITGLITVIIQFAINFFLSPFIVKALGTEANGYTQLASNFVMYASLLTIAFNSMASRFVAVEYHRRNYDKMHRYYISVFISNIFIILTLIPIAIYTITHLENIITISNTDVRDVKILFACVFLNFFVSTLISMYSISMYVKNTIYYSNIINCVKTLLNAFLLIIVFTYLPAKMYYISLIALFLGTLIFPVYIYIQKKNFPKLRFIPHKFSFSAVKDLVSSGLWNSINQCGHLLLTGLDLLISNLLVSALAMGLIAISKTIPSAIIQLSSTINSNFSPSITETWSKGNNEALLRQLRTSMSISSILISIPIVTFCCMGSEFYRLWQPTLNAQTLTTLSILGCISFIPVSGTQALFNIFTATNKLMINSLSFVIMGILNIVLVYTFIKIWPEYAMYSIVGISSILSLIRNFIIVLPYTAKILNLKWYTFYKDAGITILCVIINMIIAFSISNNYPTNEWTPFLFKTSLVITFSFIAECFIILDNEKRQLLFKILKIKK